MIITRVAHSFSFATGLTQILPSLGIAGRLKAAMRKMSAKDAAAARKRFMENGRAYRKTKVDLIEAAREAENADRLPEYLWPDADNDAWFHRKSEASKLIEKRGGFSGHVATLALTDPQWETKEAVASWLRRELKVLRDAELEAGAAPVRRGRALSKSTISDVAIELLECIGGESLICLFQELLDIDRHRKALAEVYIQLDGAARSEAQFELQGGTMGVRAFAKHLSVSPSTVTRWRKSPAFLQRVEFHKHVWGNFLRDEYFDQIRKESPAIEEAECFRQAFRLYGLSIPERQGKMSVETDESSAGVAPVLPPTAHKSRGKKSRRDSDSKSKG
jgi:hypothetical protein